MKPNLTNSNVDQESEEHSGHDEMIIGEQLAAMLAKQHNQPLDQVKINPAHQIAFDMIREQQATSAAMGMTSPSRLFREQVAALARRRQLRATQNTHTTYREGHELTWDKGTSYECESDDDEEADPDTYNYNSKDGAWRNSPYY